MTVLLTLFLVVGHGPIDQRQDQPSVRIFAVSQQKFKNRGHYPDNNRRVVFKLVNDSSKPVIVYGFQGEAEFDPIGYLISFDEKLREWVYPNPENAATPWSERSDLDKQKHILLPGKSITFEAEMSRAEVGMRFKMTAYVSFKEYEDPIEIRGEEFVLK